MTALMIVSVVGGWLAVGFLLSRYTARWCYAIRRRNAGYSEIDANAVGWMTVPLWPLTLVWLTLMTLWRRRSTAWSPNRWIMKDIES